MTTASRQAAERRGRRAEMWAALFLMAKGYRILARRARTPFGEVDIAALKGDVFAVVEVKARRARDDGLRSFGPATERRIAQAGLALSQRLGLKRVRLRFDLVVVSRWGAIHHLRDAWRVDGHG